MKKKIVEYLASEAMYALVEAESEANGLRKYNDLQIPTEGGGLDLAVLLEGIKKAQKLVELLT